MNKLRIGDERDLIHSADSDVFSLDIYRETGFFVVRNVVPKETVRSWQNAWAEFYAETLSSNRKVDPFNPVHVHEQTPDDLASIHRTPEILDVLEGVYPDLALFMQRFVIKDAKSRGKVFVHSDFGYDYGWPEKTTTFIPLSPSNERNGGISFYPGTNHLGYMGDVGEVNLNLLDDSWPLVCPSLQPGDIALCHTCTWHFSPPYQSGPDRVLVQATYQPSSDPSSTALLRGEDKARYLMSGIPRDKFFARSRSSRLRELQQELDKLKSMEVVAG